MLSKAAGKAIGKLFRNLRNPRWIAQQTAETLTTITVVNYAGKKVKAFAKGHVVHDHADGTEVKIGDVYHCQDGHDYIHSGGKTYRYDATVDGWHPA